MKKWNIGHDNLINVIGINFIYFNFWYLHPDAINLIYVREMTDIGVPVGTTLYKSKSSERSSDSIRTWMPGLFHEFEYLGLHYQQKSSYSGASYACNIVMLVTSWCWWHYDAGEPKLPHSWQQQLHVCSLIHSLESNFFKNLDFWAFDLLKISWLNSAYLWMILHV